MSLPKLRSPWSPPLPSPPMVTRSGGRLEVEGRSVGGREIQFIALPENRRDGVRWTRETEDSSGDAGEWSGYYADLAGLRVRGSTSEGGRSAPARAVECSLTLHHSSIRRVALRPTCRSPTCCSRKMKFFSYSHTHHLGRSKGFFPRKVRVLSFYKMLHTMLKGDTLQSVLVPSIHLYGAKRIARRWRRPPICRDR